MHDLGFLALKCSVVDKLRDYHYDAGQGKQTSGAPSGVIYGLYTVPLFMSCMIGVNLSICTYSILYV